MPDLRSVNGGHLLDGHYVQGINLPEVARRLNATLEEKGESERLL
jgi:hypothetical protein